MKNTPVNFYQYIKYICMVEYCSPVNPCEATQIHIIFCRDRRPRRSARIKQALLRTVEDAGPYIYVKTHYGLRQVDLAIIQSKNISQSEK